MVIHIRINGFGRASTTVLRSAIERSKIQIVAINDLWYKNSTRGIFDGEISVQDSHLIVKGYKIKFCREKHPAATPCKDAGAEYIVDATGIFIKEAQAKAHLSVGFKKVLSCSPSVDALMFIMDVNLRSYDSSTDVISGASCKTNAISPLAKVINDRFTIVEGLITTIHAYTVNQKLVDWPSHKYLRDGRSAPQNIIPSNTSAATAVGEVLPELEGKLFGIAMIVPISSISVVDLTCRVKKEASLDEMKDAVKEAANGNLKFMSSKQALKHPAQLWMMLMVS
ncbi:related to Glyceraldehyde-3-phosphate dehydrogenase [Rhynchosporium secalis]|uniref:glyceraldehyde-3-phosphate dehydrogenase (phosphorylating) n=1 Tax=Rhynchosporium secalis TaxID=38038 RepID=A0A1E1LXJ9_RHYSE|nr:related to Glyceraldehyde-3-phosphate dehydrogenase [Rhynchosporium secalis]